MAMAARAARLILGGQGLTVTHQDRFNGDLADFLAR
jgi:hypothetical protein